MKIGAKHKIYSIVSAKVFYIETFYSYIYAFETFKFIVDGADSADYESENKNKGQLIRAHVS